MIGKNIIKPTGGNFHLTKWYLDFTGENGETMIFYAAKLNWHGLSVSYTSWLKYNIPGIDTQTRFLNVQLPIIQDNIITWNDSKFGVSGVWEPTANMIQARIYNSSEGFLDWNCYQPASKVQLKFKDKTSVGRGYAEELILTVPPWKIPMDELRWGHFGADEYNIVWIELKEQHKRQWLWLNGEKTDNCIIDDKHISIPGKDLILNLDCGVILESEKKIASIIEKLIHYLPGFKKIMPLNFLMADESKWLSKGELQRNSKNIVTGTSIHELVNFKA